MALFKLTNSVFTSGNMFSLRSCLLPHLNMLNISAAGLKHSSSPVVNIPSRPKKPLSPYFKFQGQMRHKIIEQNPSIKVVEIPKVVSAEWKKISEADKSKLESEYAKEKEIYVQEVKKYEDQLTPEIIEFLRKEKAERRERKEKREMKKLFRETGKPKKPGNSFYLFIKDTMTKTEYQNQSYMSLLPVCAKMWADLGESEKQKYVLEYQKKYEKYKKDLLKWEESLIREGKLERIETRGFHTTLSKNKK